MKLRLAFATVLFIQGTNAQSTLWDQSSVLQPVEGAISYGEIDTAVPLSSQVKAIGKLLKATDDAWTCAVDDPKGEWLKSLRYKTIPLSRTANAYLVEAGTGCARGGQGSNGAMWLIRFVKGRPILLAGPKQDFGGWVFSVEASASKGYHDIILAWHMSAEESALAYFRFDGTVYHHVADATLIRNEQGDKLTPRPPSRP